MNYVENAVVTRADVVVERGFILTVRVCVDSARGSQCFGDVVLGGMTNTDAACNDHTSQPNYMAEWVAGILGACGSESLSGCVGKVVRIERKSEYGSIEGIGHAIKDFWFKPSENRIFGKESES